MANRHVNGVDWLGQPAAIFPKELHEMNVKSSAEAEADYAELTSSGPSLDTDPIAAHDLNFDVDPNANFDTNFDESLENNVDPGWNINMVDADSKPSAVSHLFPTRPKPPSREELQAGVRECLKVQARAVQNGKQPFGACLVGPDNMTVILTQGNVDHVNHAECTLARSAAAQFTQEYLWTCTLYSTWEPCAMCASTIYWANIGRIVYAASNDQLLQLTGKNNPANMTMKWHCRDVLSDSQKDIEIIGPISGIDKVVMMESDIYWSQIRGKMSDSEYDAAKIPWSPEGRWESWQEVLRRNR